MFGRRNIKLGEEKIMAEERKKFFTLVKKLHVYYRDQLSAALISISKFEKGRKYFIRALKVIFPVSYDDIPVLTLQNMEDDLALYKEKSPENSVIDNAVTCGTTSVRSATGLSPEVIGNRLESTPVRTRASSTRREDPAISQHKAHCQIIETFLKNIHNFRLFRQHVKMNIVTKLQKIPNNVVETDMQKRALGEIEALLGAWTILLDRNNNLVRLVHPEVGEQANKIFETEQEMAYYTGILSVLPKLNDIANKIEFALTKYEMSADRV
ncbi:uncharacterized protein LOC121410688 [Lytechinus variegatus]|uniref:uncharacterized protein LOC121410688 n=1 Tax=Lytechinus variegatus TaxID=7654 RepID=UPI001BB1FBFB|nr:uncharacterized protein LOC121410688 [Lytechinus variegatus]